MKNANITLTADEANLIDSIGAEARGKEFGRLNVRRYTGFNTALLALNGTQKNIGKAYFVKKENTWYFDAINGERYRIPEPKDGIDSVLDIEFKRKDV